MLIHESPLPIVEIPTTSITAHVLRTVDSMPDRVAIAAVDGSSSYTFSELDDAIHRFAGALVAGGFHPGDTLGIMAPNVPEYAVVFHGTAVAGGTVTTINPTYGAGEVATQLHDDAGGFFTAVRAALPALRESHGAVVAVTTAATTRFPKRDGLSSAPKAAVEAMVRALAVEEGRYGVRVNAVGPGMLTDGMAARLIGSGDLSEEALEITRRNIPLGTFGTADDIAEAVCFLASDRAGFISGQKLDVDGGYGA